MIARLLVALLRVVAALLGGFGLLLVLVMLLERPDVWTCFAFSMIGFFALKGAAALWAWQDLIRRLFPTSVPEQAGMPRWIGPRRGRHSPGPFMNDSRSHRLDPTVAPANDLDEGGLYSPEYTLNTGRRYSGRRRKH